MNLNQLSTRGRILVVDDSIDSIHLINHALKEEHEVVFALDGETALAIVRARPPDLILLDAVMPGMDGYAVCAALKEASHSCDIPVIFVTALSRPEDETRALAAGAVDFITKPVNLAVVRARVRTHLTLKRQSDLLRRMSLTDALTGVANRRCFDETLETEWKRCERTRQPIALIMADIDHFKAYNDHYGHQAGDRCLAAVAQAMDSCVNRPPDMLARYGGEEFVALLPSCDAAGAATIAGRMLEAVRDLAIPHADAVDAPYVTVSLGIAAMDPDRATSAAVLLAAADAALYAAKEAGRNQYHTAPLPASPAPRLSA